MKEIIQTDRLVIRTWELDDADVLFQICQDPQVMLHIGSGKAYQSVDEAYRFLNWAVAYQSQNGFCRWAVIEKSSRNVIGSCGFARLENSGEIEFGYLFDRQMWGKGYATEATEACLRYGFRQLGFTEVIALTDPEHIASQRVVENLGFVCRGVENYGDENNKVYVAVNSRG
jgi:ribosomal-protein-alanine N-acetyltransferase